MWPIGATIFKRVHGGCPAPTPTAPCRRLSSAAASAPASPPRLTPPPPQRPHPDADWTALWIGLLRCGCQWRIVMSALGGGAWVGRGRGEGVEPVRAAIEHRGGMEGLRGGWCAHQLAIWGNYSCRTQGRRKFLKFQDSLTCGPPTDGIFLIYVFFTYNIALWK
jgi:hypothetical protein